MLLSILQWTEQLSTPPNKISSPQSQQCTSWETQRLSNSQDSVQGQNKCEEYYKTVDLSPATENDAFGWERRQDGWEEAGWTEITLGSQRDMNFLHLHSLPLRLGLKKIGDGSVFGVGRWDHKEKTIPMPQHRSSRKCGSLGQAWKKHRECHFWRRLEHGNERRLRDYHVGQWLRPRCDDGNLSRGQSCTPLKSLEHRCDPGKVG